MVTGEPYRRAGATSGLDPSYERTVAPPGSNAYYALLFSPADKRTQVLAAMALGQEILGAARQSQDPAIVHARIHWWHEELVALTEGRARHPLTQVLQDSSSVLPPDILHELPAAAAKDAAAGAYRTFEELTEYCCRSYGAIQVLVSVILAGERLAEGDPVEHFARKLGSGTQLAGIIMAARRDAERGRVYLPQELLAEQNVATAAFAEPVLSEPAAAVLDRVAEVATGELDQALSALPVQARPTQRTGLVQAALYRRLLRGRRFVSGKALVDLHPLMKLWVAWHTARRAVRHRI